jgi:nicotinamide mononucleotide transporter
MNDSLVSLIPSLDTLDFLGLIFGLLTVLLLIRENIWTWPAGIIYVLISLVVFWKSKLYADVILHIIYFFLNIYGWYFWIFGRRMEDSDLKITTQRANDRWIMVFIAATGSITTGILFQTYTDASLPFWDSAIAGFSLAGIWLTAKKKIENWFYWFFVDITATGVYAFKGLYFYALLYGVYIILAAIGYWEWRKKMILRNV